MPNKITDHLKYLDHQIDSAPFGTDDEYEAAQYISEVFESRGFEPELQEFAVPAMLSVTRSICMIGVFLGAILSGVDITAVKVIGVILVLVGSTLLLLDYLGHPFFGKLTPAAGSQNVIAKHTGKGELAGRGVRPIILVAHYDTPHESILVKNNAARLVPWVKTFSYYGIAAVLVLSLIKLPLPTMVYNIMWVLAIVAGLLPLVAAVVTLIDYNSAYTEGANNNKAALAALFKLAETVSNGGDSSLYERLDSEMEDSDFGETEQIVIDDTQETVEEKPEPYGVRHGAETIHQFGILPESCEIVEVDVDQDLNKMNLTDDSNENKISENVVYFGADDSEDISEAVDVSSDVEDDSDCEIQDQDDLESTSPMEPVKQEDYQQTPDDDSWGKTAFTPQALGHRSQLFDLPDPRENEVDPFIDNDTVAVSQPTVVTTIQEELKVIKPQEVEVQQEDEDKPVSKSHKLLSALSNTAAKAKKTRLFSRKRHEEEKMTDWLGLDENYDAKKDGREISSWDNFEDNNWKGGATTPQFVVLEGNASSEDIPTDEDLRDAVMDMAEDLKAAPDQEAPLDDKLICHDIWFVATGASEASQAGMKAFLDEHRRDLRGAFLINLDAIGAGDLTLLTKEGFYNDRRADRRVSRIVKTTAKELGIDLKEDTYTWSDTDATPAMRKSVRSVTLMGTQDAIPALWGSPDDVLDEIDTNQIMEAVHLVQEVIRRS